jgi:hypothetical protein
MLDTQDFHLLSDSLYCARIAWAHAADEIGAFIIGADSTLTVRQFAVQAK